MLLDNILAVCADFQEKKEEYASNWENGFMPFHYWLDLSEQTADLIKKHRAGMLKSSKVFSEQLCYGYTVIFLNDRIVKYADNKSNSHKFKLAVDMLFKS